jgi:hypothetical protein
MQESGCTSLPVVDHGELIGLITLEHVGKWLMVRGALDGTPDHGARPAAGVTILVPKTASKELS